MKVLISGYDVDEPGSEDLLYALDADSWQTVERKPLEPWPVEKPAKSSGETKLACGKLSVVSAEAYHACQPDSLDALCGTIGGARTRVPEHVDCPQCLSLSNVLILNHLQSSTA